MSLNFTRFLSTLGEFNPKSWIGVQAGTGGDEIKYDLVLGLLTGFLTRVTDKIGSGVTRPQDIGYQDSKSDLGQDEFI